MLKTGIVSGRIGWVGWRRNWKSAAPWGWKNGSLGKNPSLRQRAQGPAYRHRAQGLALLSSLINAHRDTLLQKLQAPLQARVDHYLRLWSPDARRKLGADLEPAEIHREYGLSGVESAAFSALSFGARKQMALLMRLAYADILKDAGRPTLIILDDVLANSDAVRLGAMKRIHTDATKKHEILLLSCHEEDWKDMGVPMRSIGNVV